MAHVWTGSVATSRRRAGILLAALPLGLALVYEVAATVLLALTNSSWTTNPPDESLLRLIAWQYRFDLGPLGGGVLEWGYPPLPVGLALLVAALMINPIDRGVDPVRKAKGRVVMIRWSAREEKARLRAELRAGGYATVVSGSARVRLFVGGAAAAVLAVASMGWPIEDGFSRGYGPAVCGAAGLLAVLGVLLATPWAPWPTAVVNDQGQILIDGIEPRPSSGGAPDPAAGRAQSI
jgi:hypothetical protein